LYFRFLRLASFLFFILPNMIRILLAALLFFGHLLHAQNALDFDGLNDYVSMTSPGPTGTSDRTVECWIKTSASQQTQQILVDWGSASPLGARFTLNMIAFGKIRIEVGGNGFNSTQSVADGNWHHIAVTYDHAATTKVRMYIDGVLETSNNFTQSVNTANSGIRIGRRVDGVNYFDGIIDEVRIWNVVRTQAEISASMNNEFCSAPSGLVAYYTFNQGIAGGNNAGVSVLNDGAGNNNGTLNNFMLSGTTSNWVAGKSLNSGSTTPGNDTIIGCDSLVSPSGIYTWTTSGNYVDTITSPLGCDSVVNINLTLNSSSTGQLTTTACNTYTSPSGNNTWTSSGTYTDVIPNAVGCDSVITINLTVNTVDTNVLQNGIVLTSWATGVDYQWLDCNNGYTPISGATSQTFVPTTDGSYAVELDDSGCVDTSACYIVTGVGIDEENGLGYRVYPNPVTEHLHITFDRPHPSATLSLFDLTGNVLYQNNLNANHADLTISVKDLPRGMYFLKIESSKMAKLEKIIVR
jgi:hypothetical protein